MKKYFSFRGKSSLPITSSLRDGFGLRRDKRIVARNSQQGYNIRDKDLKKIHRAACLGDVAKMHHILVLGKNGINDRDKMHRTALHLACANGHPDVVSLLVERKCQLNLYDKEARTPLMKAVQCQEESCVTILLEHGADPNLTDGNGNTALHYAAVGQNVSIVEKLLLHNADIEGRNKDDLTPFLLAVAENKQQIVEFLMERGANIHAIDRWKRTALMLAVTYESTDIVKLLLQEGINIFFEDECGWTAEEYATVSGFNVSRQLIAEHREAIRPKNCSQNSNPENWYNTKEKIQVVDKSSEDTSSRLSVYRGADDSWPPSDDDDFNIKNVPKPSLRKLMAACEKFKNLETKCGLMTVGDNLSLTDDNSDHKDEDTKVYDLFCPAIPSPSTLKKPLGPLEGLGVTKEGEVLSAIAKKDNGIDTESAPQGQTVNDNLTSDRAYKNNGDVMVLGLEEEEDRESPWDSETNSESLPKKYVNHSSGTTDQKGSSILNEEVEDVFYIPSCMSGSRNLKMAKVEDTRNVGIPVAHMDSPEKYPYSKPTAEMKEFVPNTTVELEKQTFKSDSLEKYPYSKLIVEVKDSVPNKTVEIKKKQASTSERNLEMTSEEEQERLGKSENNHLQMVEERKRHESDKLAVSESIYAAAATGLIQQRASGKTANHLCPIMEDEDSDGDPRLSLKEARIKDKNEKWTSKESLITPRFEKVDSPTYCPLQVNDDSPLSEMHQDEGRPAKKTSKEKKEVKKQINFTDDLDDLTLSSGTSSEDCKLPCFDFRSCLLLIEQLGMDCKDSVNLLKIQDAVLSYERLIELKKTHCEQLIKKNKKMESRINGLQKELSETKEIKSQLEQQKVEWEQELCSLRFSLKQEKEKRRNTDMLYEKTREQLKRKEEQYNREVELKQQLELTLRTRDEELRTVRNNLNQVVEEQNDTKKQLSQEQNARILQDGILNHHLCKQKELEKADKKTHSGVFNSHEKEKGLLHKNHRCQDEIAMLRLEIDTINSQNREKEKKYCEDIAIIKEKNASLQNTIKLNEETLTKTIFQYSGQINALTTENTMLKSKSEGEKQNKERLDAKVESYRARLASAIQDRDQIQTSKRDVELAFQRAKDEWVRVQDKLNFDVSNLKDNNELLSQNLSKTEGQLNTLEIELHHTRDALREKTLVLERVQGDLSQTQCQKKEIEHMYQNEQDKVNKYIGKQESLEERLSQLQSENTLLQQQLDDAYNKAAGKEKIVINIQEQFQDIVKKLQAESEKRGLMFEERNKELMNECNLLKERIYQYEKEKVEREVAMRQLQLELADTLKKQSMSEASLEVTSRCRINLEDEAQDLKKKLSQIRSQLQEAQDRHAEAVRCIEKSKDHVQKLEGENAELKARVKKQAGRIEELQENLLSTSSSDNEREQMKKFIELKQSLECCLDQEMKKNGELEKEITRLKKLSRMTRSEVDDLTAKLETASSKCLQLDEKNQVLSQELLSMKELQKKCEKLEKNKKKLEQQVVNLKSHAEVNMAEYSRIEQYKQELDERARLDMAEKLREVNLFLQAQVASQESLEQLRDTNNASIISQMELRMKDLEFELSKMKSSQEDSNKTELEKYKQLYLEEVKVRTSLTNELNRTNERLAEIRTKLLMEKQQKRNLFHTVTMNPILELPYVRNINNSLALDRHVAPRENVMIHTSSSWPSNNGIETYLLKVQQEFEKNISRELEAAAAEFESDSSYYTSSSEFSSESHLNQVLWKTSEDFLQNLRSRYRI